MSSRAVERIKHLVLFAFVAINTLLIVNDDVNFVRESAASNGSVWFSCESHGKVEERINLTSTERELDPVPG